MVFFKLHETNTFSIGCLKCCCDPLTLRVKCNRGDRITMVPEEIISVIKKLTKKGIRFDNGVCSITDPEISVHPDIPNIHHSRT